MFFENGDFASLAGIAVTPGVIEPPFYSGTFEYFVLLTVDDLPDMRVALTPVATQPDATIRIGGLYGKQVRSGDTFRIGVRLGENKVLIVVTSPNGLSTRTYIVTVYVLMDEEEALHSAIFNSIVASSNPRLCRMSSSIRHSWILRTTELVLLRTRSLEMTSRCVESRLVPLKR